jgi:hypothetical protein
VQIQGTEKCGKQSGIAVVEMDHPCAHQCCWCLLEELDNADIIANSSTQILVAEV